MKKITGNQLIRGKLILLKTLVFFALACCTVSCIESVLPEDAVKKVHDKKKGDDPEDPNHDGEGLPPCHSQK